MGPAQRNAWPLPVTGFDQTFLWEAFLSLCLPPSLPLVLFIVPFVPPSLFPVGYIWKGGDFEVNI